MTIAILTLILVSYMKITGKTLPAIEKRLNKVKNSKQKTKIINKVEPEIKNIEIETITPVSFKKQPRLNTYNTHQLFNNTYSGPLKI